MKYKIFDLTITITEKQHQLIAEDLDKTVKEWDVLGNYCKAYTRFLVLYGVIQALSKVLLDLGEVTAQQYKRFNKALESKYKCYYREEG